MELFEIINAYHYYMWNAWNEDEYKRVFDGCDAAHMWKKWNWSCSAAGMSDMAVSTYWAILDALRRKKLADRAVIWYTEKK